jgi:predicted site-specific integrase-resolvase
MPTTIKPSEVVKLNSFPPIEDRLNQAQVAELFGTTVQTIITWKKKGKIPYFQMGRFPIFSKKQLTQVASKNQHLIKV